MKKIILKLIFFLLFLLPNKIFAIELNRMLFVASNAGFDTTDPVGLTPFYVINMVIIIILGLLGIIFVIQIIIAGYQYLTSGGNEETIKHAKDRIKTSVLGLAIILVAYVITSFIITQLINATTSGEGGSGPGGP